VECKEAGGHTTIVDGTFVGTICRCVIYLCGCSIVFLFPLEKQQEVAMEAVAKLQEGATTESHSLKTPEQQRDIFTSIVETYSAQSIKGVVKENGGCSSSTVNHGLGLAGLAATNDLSLGHLTAGKSY
jgi:hypothetical protein